MNYIISIKENTQKIRNDMTPLEDLNKDTVGDGGRELYILGRPSAISFFWRAEGGDANYVIIKSLYVTVSIINYYVVCSPFNGQAGIAHRSVLRKDTTYTHFQGLNLTQHT